MLAARLLGVAALLSLAYDGGAGHTYQDGRVIVPPKPRTQYGNPAALREEGVDAPIIGGDQEQRPREEARGGHGRRLAIARKRGDPYPEKGAHISNQATFENQSFVYTLAPDEEGFGLIKKDSGGLTYRSGYPVFGAFADTWAAGAKECFSAGEGRGGGGAVLWCHTWK